MQILKNPYYMVILVTLVLLFFLIVVPLFSILRSTFILAENEARRVGGNPGDYTLHYWKVLTSSYLSNALLWKPLGQSLLIAFSTCLIAVPLGATMAWLVVRTDIPGKNILSKLIIIPYMIPSWTKSMAWLSVFRNSQGGSPGLLEGMGLTIPNWLAYAPGAIIAVLATHYYAFTYIMVSSTLRTVNSELEEMGEIQGAKKSQILRRITLPLVLPALFSSIIMTFSKGLGTYGVPANLGMRVGYFTLSTRLHDSLSVGVKGIGYATAILLVIMSSGSLFANRLFLGTRKSFETVGGKGGKKSLVSLGKSRYIVSIIILLFLGGAMVFPLLVLLSETFQIAPGAGYHAENLTMYFWNGTLEEAPASMYRPGIFKNPEFFSAFFNTVRLSLVAAVITALFGQFFGYIGSRGRGKWYGTLTEQLVFIPYLIPSVAFSAVFLALFIKPIGPFPSLYGTFALLVIVSVVKHFPFASRSGTANMLQIGVQLEEAAEINGASFWRKMVKIVIPLAKNGFFSGFILVFISIAKELDLIALLVTPSTSTLAFTAFSYSNGNYPQMASAISVVMIVFIFVVYWIANKLFNADLSKSWG